MAKIEENGKAQDGEALATVLAIGTANPTNCLYQADFPDYYFSTTESEDLVDLKFKFKRICERTMIDKRYKYPVEEIIKKNPNLLSAATASLDARLDFEIDQIPKLGAEAALKAIEEWGQPKTNITHLIFHSYSGLSMPGADYKLVNLVGLKPSVKRIMLYHNGCYGGGAVTRIAKDIAENNTGARVLAVCSEIMLNAFHKPSSTKIEGLVAHAIFGEGAAAMIIGTHPIPPLERPLFKIFSTSQEIIPNSEKAISGRFREWGFDVCLGMDVPKVISSQIQNCLASVFEPLGIDDWNSLFWVVHPGGAAILDAIEMKLNLKKEKLQETRHVLREYGNMSSPTVLFVLDEMRKTSASEGKTTTGSGLEWGVLLGIGPGVTIETIVLQSVPIVGA